MKKTPIAPVITITVLAFALVYACSLTFEYVEGDDARTIAYHITDSPHAFDTPYSYYHAGFDFLLKLLPAKEPLLRTFAMGLTAFAQMLYILFLIWLVLDWLRVKKSSWKAGFLALAVLLIIPEFFFMGLLYNPTSVAMCLLLGSHLVARRGFKHAPPAKWMLLVSALLFGFGVTFRWSTGLYGVVIFVDLMLLVWGQWRSVMTAVLWGIGAVAAFGIWLGIEGLGSQEVAQVLSFSEQVTSQNFSDRSFLKRILRFSTFYSPWMILLSLTGLGILLWRRSKCLLLVLSAIPCYFIFTTEHPKMTAVTHPVYVFLIGMAILGIYGKLRAVTRGSVAMGVLLVLFVIPWIGGVQANIDNLIFGPGFEMQNVDKDQVSKGRPDMGDVELSGEAFEPAWIDGFVMPTNEGPRPIAGGYAGILLGGEWRNFVQKRAHDYEQVVNAAIEESLPLVQTRIFAFGEMSLLRKGFEVKASRTVTPQLEKTTFVRPDDQKEVVVYFLKKGAKIFEADYWEAHFPHFNKVILFSWDVYLIDRLWSSEQFSGQKLNNYGLLLQKPQ